MDARQKQRIKGQRSYYTDGTSVRRLQAVPEEEQNIPELPVRRRKKIEEPAVRTRHKLAPKASVPGIDFFAMIVLTAAIGLTFFTCVNYLKVQAEIATMGKEITIMKADMDALRTKNDNTQTRINESVDLEHVYEVATAELGMIYPYNNQVISYELAKENYVRQYGELLGNEDESVMDMLLKSLLEDAKR